MERGMVGFIVAFIVLALASVALGNVETIKPAVAAAEMNNATGPDMALAVNKGLSLLMKFVLGGVFSGLALFVYSEAKGAYRLWKKNQQTRRWQPGPNAQFRQPQQTKLTKNDLMFMSLLGGRTPGRMNLEKRQLPRQDENEDLDIDLS